MAHENVQLVVETLEKLRNDEAFNEVRRKSNDQVTEVLEFIEKEFPEPANTGRETLRDIFELLEVLKIFSTLPVTSCEAERSFSTLK